MSRFMCAVIVCAFCASVFGIEGDMGHSTDVLADGSVDHPWLIEDFGDFDMFSSEPNYWDEGVHVKLMSDIDLEWGLDGRVYYYTEAPIGGYVVSEEGTSLVAYSGVFDGNGHVISNLAVLGDDYCGLFGVQAGSGSVIKNLGLENVLVCNGYGCGYTGALCGSSSGTITNCYSTGKVFGSNYVVYVGGLCGKIFDGGGNTVTGCWSTCYVDTGVAEYVGGFCGQLDVVCSGCYHIGEVGSGIESWCIGGFAGASSMDIDDCYAEGEVWVDFNSAKVGGFLRVYCQWFGRRLQQ